MDVNKIPEMILEKILAGDRKGAAETARQAVQTYAETGKPTKLLDVLKRHLMVEGFHTAVKFF